MHQIPHTNTLTPQPKTRNPTPTCCLPPLFAIQQVLSPLLTTFEHRLPSSSPTDVASLVWALRYVSHPGSARLAALKRPFLLQLVRRSAPLLPTLRPGELVQLVDGFTGLGLYPGVGWMKAHR